MAKVTEIDREVAWKCGHDEIRRSEKAAQCVAAYREEIEGRYAGMVEALRLAGEAVHSEYCRTEHHPLCAKVAAAIAKAEGR
jgi:hypothetical protein